MFESDDYDQVLSQFDFPEDPIAKPHELVIPCIVPNSQDSIACTNESTINKDPGVSNGHINYIEKNHNILQQITDPGQNVLNNLKDPGHSNKHAINNQIIAAKGQKPTNSSKDDNIVSPKHLKRKILKSHFDQKSKRKFPGPAGLLTGVLEGTQDESIAEIEFLSQDMDFTESNLRKDIFESALWKRLLNDTQNWNVNNVDSIKTIKQQALTGNLRRRKARSVIAFIEAVDRSITDPLIILRDETGSIKCTLHRDAWSTFSPYLVSEYCALVLQKPTVLTTGGAFKKHYLNITLSNILAIFSSAVLDVEKDLPNGYSTVYKKDYTVIKTEILKTDTTLDTSNDVEDIFDGLDNCFSDEIFI